MKDARATMLEGGTKRNGKIPCVATQGYIEDECRGEGAPYEAPPIGGSAPLRPALKVLQAGEQPAAELDHRPASCSEPTARLLGMSARVP